MDRKFVISDIGRELVEEEREKPLDTGTRDSEDHSIGFRLLPRFSKSSGGSDGLVSVASPGFDGSGGFDGIDGLFAISVSDEFQDSCAGSPHIFVFTVDTVNPAFYT